ncbi:unnamed protein product [Leptosia nina]|uniref:Homeobox domain-containing protein n=1 Tax=Leptosia nina TaxID=320188 RepID=A0AAV1J8M2_9NEOP
MSDTQDSQNETEMQTVLSNFIPDIGHIESTDNYYEGICSSDDKTNVDDEKDIEVDVTEEIDNRNDFKESTSHPSNGVRNQENNESRDSLESWHPHVYGKPPKMPTPHTIEYILGLSKDDSKKTVSSLMSVKRFGHEKDTKLVQNRLQEQLLQRSRNSDSAYVKDEPLNLSVPKTWSDEEKFNKETKLIKRKKSTDDVRSPLGGEGSMTSEEGEDPGAARRKKARTTFTGRQIFELEKLFEVKKYLSSGERADMAKLLNVTETQLTRVACLLPNLGVNYHWVANDDKTPDLIDFYATITIL